MRRRYKRPDVSTAVLWGMTQAEKPTPATPAMRRFLCDAGDVDLIPKTRAMPRLPHMRLMAAVLERAILDTRSLVAAEDKNSAIDWFNRKGPELFSLAVVCETLGLDAESVRRKTLAGVRRAEDRTNRRAAGSERACSGYW